LGVAGAAGVSLAAGCAGPAATLAERSGSAPQDLLLVRVSSGLAGILPASGRTAFTMPAALPAPDWSSVFRTAPLGDSDTGTRLATIDPLSGAERATAALDGAWEAVVAATGGRLVALLPRDGGAGRWAAAPYQPAGRARTTICVADPTSRTEPRRYDLEGNFEPEAFSNDAQSLYLLEYLPPLAPDRYRVRQLVLRPQPGQQGQQQIQPVLTRDKRPNLEEMRGTGRMHAFAPGCRALYTLYTQQPEHVHARDMLARGGSGQSSGMSHAFVHVLSLAEWWAYCIDLPLPFGVGPSTAHALAVAPNSRTLYVADASSGRVAVADTMTLQITRTDRVETTPPAMPSDTAATAVAGAAGTLYLASGSEIVTLPPPGSEAKARWSLGEAVRGLAVSAGGTHVYAALEDRLLVLDAQDGHQVGSVAIPGLESLVHVAPAPAAPGV
jgi:hypothetical protein